MAMRNILLIASLVALQACAGVAQESPEGKPPRLIDVPVSELYTKYQLISELGVPFGQVVTVQGVFVKEPFKARGREHVIRVQRINGKATQKDIRLSVDPNFIEDDDHEKKNEDMRDLELRELERGKTYELTGYQTGGFVGIPSDLQNGLIQTTGFYFHQGFEIDRGKVINVIIFSPADFVNREALLEGKAVNRGKKAYIEGNGWKLLTNATGEWPKDLGGKTVEGLGTVKVAGTGGYWLDHGVTRLVKLEDQVGRSVELRGTAWSLNGYWWFEYRGIELYVENMDKLPGWTYPHGDPIVITGVLEEDNLPDIAQFRREGSGVKKKCFIVRKAGWKPLDALLAPERTDRW
jgi:hypothetical protein